MPAATTTGAPGVTIRAICRANLNHAFVLKNVKGKDVPLECPYCGCHEFDREVI